MDFSAPITFFIIAIAAGFIWYSGSKLAIYADWIAHRFKIGRAFLGALLLAFVTTSPEIAVTITAASIDSAQLAISNLLGGINLQTFVLAVADLCFVKGALTYFSPKSSLLIGGIAVILQLSIVAIGISYGEILSFWNLGFWPFFLFAVYLLMLYYVKRHEEIVRWIPKESHQMLKVKFPTPSKRQFSNTSLITFFCLNTLVVFTAGVCIAYFSDHLAEKIHWSGSWMGATLVAFTTSLPELSTTLGAVRQRAYVLAIANIFGSNALTISLIFFADLFYRKKPILSQATSEDLLLIGAGIIMTVLFLWGILERRNKTFLRMGLDSFFVAITYLGSLILLFYRYF